MPLVDEKDAIADQGAAGNGLFSLFCCIGNRSSHKSKPRRRTDGQGEWPEGFLQAHETTNRDMAPNHAPPAAAPAKKTPARVKKQSRGASRPVISKPYDFKHVSSGTPFSEPTTTQVQQLPHALLRGQRLYRDLELRNFSPPENPSSSALFSFSKRSNAQLPGAPAEDRTPKRSISMPPPPKHRRRQENNSNESAVVWASFFLPTWPAKPEMGGHKRSRSVSNLLDPIQVIDSERPISRAIDRSVSTLSFHVPRKPRVEVANRSHSTIYENEPPAAQPSASEQPADQVQPHEAAENWDVDEKKVLLSERPRGPGRPQLDAVFSPKASSETKRSSFTLLKSKSCTALHTQSVEDELTKAAAHEKKILLSAQADEDESAPPYTESDSNSKTASDWARDSIQDTKVSSTAKPSGRGHTRSYTAYEVGNPNDRSNKGNNRLSRKNSLYDPQRQGLRRSRSSASGHWGDMALKLDASTAPFPPPTGMLVPYRFKFQPQRQSLFSNKSHNRRQSEMSSVDSMVPRDQTPTLEEIEEPKTALPPPPAPKPAASKRKSLSQVASWLFSNHEASSSGFLIDPVTALTHPAVTNKEKFPPPTSLNLLNRRFSEGSMGTVTTWDTEDDRTIQSVWSLNGTTVGMGRGFFIPRAFPADRPHRFSSPLSHIGAAV